MSPRHRYHRPPVSMDRTSPQEDLQRISMTMRDWALALGRMGAPLDAELGALDAVEGIIIDRLAREPEDSRRLLAFCFLVALRQSTGAWPDSNE